MANNQCSVNGCLEKYSGRGFCKSHYDKWKRHGSPLWIPESNALCEVENCSRKAHARGVCGNHYYRLIRYGDPLGGGIERHPELPFEDRFWLRVDKSGGDDACWEWMAARHYKGYGEIQLSGKQKDKAHRVAYRLWTKTEIPKGMVIMHDCDNPPCCNPRHLRMGTPSDNNTDKISKGRQARGERSGKAKLTAAIVREIRRRYNPSARVFVTTLAAEYGVSSRHISGIVRHESWNHL